MNAPTLTAADPADLVGRAYGAWTVLQRSTHTGAGASPRIRVYWECRCRCGHTAPVVEWDLVRGHSTQCRACAQAQRAACIEAHAKLPDHITLTPDELFLARMLAREGLHTIGIIALFAKREDTQRDKDRMERKTPGSKAAERDERHRRAYRARLKARKAAASPP